MVYLRQSSLSRPYKLDASNSPFTNPRISDRTTDLILRSGAESAQADQADANHHGQHQQPLLRIQLVGIMQYFSDQVVYHGFSTTNAGYLQISLRHKSPADIDGIRAIAPVAGMLCNGYACRDD
jgi:hypothetical protein